MPQGITAVLNFQSESERANWGINSESINDACCQNNILMVNYPIRYVMHFQMIQSPGLIFNLHC